MLLKRLTGRDGARERRQLEALRAARREERGGMSAPVAIDARAALRVEIGGVERVARELAARLPALFPGRYEVVRPRPGLAHRAGHAWEQFALP